MYRLTCITAAASAVLWGSTAIAQMPIRPPMIPAPVVMEGLTPTEEQAHTIWNLRAALNVAALQCQFSPFLATVSNYNRMLRYHAGEFDHAHRILADYFKRRDKGAAQKTFDQYTTRTYNSFSTLDAQIGFCEKASAVGRETLIIPRNNLSTLATQRVPEIRASLIPKSDPLMVVDTSRITMPPYYFDPCIDKKGRRKKRC